MNETGSVLTLLVFGLAGCAVAGALARRTFVVIFGKTFTHGFLVELGRRFAGALVGLVALPFTFWMHRDRSHPAHRPTWRR